LDHVFVGGRLKLRCLFFIFLSLRKVCVARHHPHQSQLCCGTWATAE
jgi:hypothetical protein